MRKLLPLVGLAPLLCAASFAVAGPLATAPNAYLDGVTGLPWHGSSPFQGYYDFPTNSSPTTLTGYLDWAVFGPGEFPIGMSDIDRPPNYYLYTFQLYAKNLIVDPWVSVFLPFSTYGDLDSFVADGIDGVVPSSTQLFEDDIAIWYFDSIPAAGSTAGLAFTSPDRPILNSGAVVDDSLGEFFAFFNAPAPAASPEPATVTLLAVGVPALMYWQRRGYRRRPVNSAHPRDCRTVSKC